MQDKITTFFFLFLLHAAYTNDSQVKVALPGFNWFLLLGIQCYEGKTMPDQKFKGKQVNHWRSFSHSGELFGLVGRALFRKFLDCLLQV